MTHHTIFVAAYVRVSTEEQAEGHSIAAQLEAIRRYSADQGWEIYREYNDAGYSAAGDDRPAFRRMLADARAGRFQVLVVHKLDRLYRNLKGLLGTLEQLRDWDVAFVSLTERMDFSTPIGKVALANIGALGEFFLDNLRQETIKGKQQRARAGYWNGDLPYGYCKGLCRNCEHVNGRDCPDYGGPDKSDGRVLVPHPVDSRGLELAFKLHATGGILRR